MSQSLKLKQNENGMFDLVPDPVTKKYETVEGFETAIDVSIYTDARAPENRVNEASRRRGYVGDITTADINRVLGSILWTYEQSRITQEVLNEIGVAVEQAFVWMIDIKAILGVTARTTQLNSRSSEIVLEFRDRDNTIKRYKRLWRLTNAT